MNSLPTSPQINSRAFTLVELMVSMGIVGGTGLLLISMLVSTMKLSGENVVTNISSHRARQMLDRLGEIVRFGQDTPVLLNADGTTAAGGTADGILVKNALGGPYLFLNSNGHATDDIPTGSTSFMVVYSPSAGVSAPKVGDYFLVALSTQPELEVATVSAATNSGTTSSVQITTKQGLTETASPGSYNVTAARYRKEAYIFAPATGSQFTLRHQGHYVTNNVLVQNTVYDKREVNNIPTSDLNVGAIVPTLNSLSGFNGIVYIYDTGPGSQKAIRVTNGGVLPDAGLTIATEDGLYVKGDYNTGTTTNPNAVPSNSNPSSTAATTVSGYTTKSAALVADAIMVLSNSWSDSNANSGVGSRVASNTTLNTALVSGYVPSASSGNNGRSGYSGGMNNFPRFLETWTNYNMTFSGAFVSLYQSQKFTGSWDTGDIYAPPTRYWYFDTLLLSRVLPGIPPTGGCVRGQLSRL